MKAISGRWGVLFAVFALSACGFERPEIDQIAQTSLIGLSKKKVLACLGPTSRRVRVGTEEIWSFPIGELRTEGSFLALGLNEYATPFGSSGRCSVNIVIDRYGVSQVNYSLADGGDLPIGQQCIYSVRACVER
jgi:hypothetical protein